MDKEKELDMLSAESYDELMTEAAHDFDLSIPPAPVEEYATIAVCNRCHCEQDAKNWKCWQSRDVKLNHCNNLLIAYMILEFSHKTADISRAPTKISIFHNLGRASSIISFFTKKHSWCRTLRVSTLPPSSVASAPMPDNIRNSPYPKTARLY